ncbi:MAG: tetratricopeptide repeat protein, partial [Archangium sp.]
MATLLFAAAPAHARPDGSRNAKELIKQAGRLYDQKQYLEAAALLEKATESMNDSRLIYNLARAYDQAGKTQQALSNYEKYLTDGEDAQLRKRSRSAIDRLRLQQEKERAEAEAAAAERQRLQQEKE